jgi:hypothetical protein
VNLQERMDKGIGLEMGPVVDVGSTTGGHGGGSAVSTRTAVPATRNGCSGEAPYRASLKAGEGVDAAWDLVENPGAVVIRGMSRRVDKEALPLPGQWNIIHCGAAD